MDKRYQVFVSSTFTDLETERRGVMDALMKMDCIPAGMELFPAADEEQWEFIRRVIDESDYYLLIIGGRYGSMSKEGISFTEQEYDHAVNIGIHVVALLHGDPDQIPAAKTEMGADARERLQSFREKVRKNRLVRTWTTGADLRSEVILSLTHAFRTHPRAGWVRGGSTANPELLQQINDLRQRNEQLQKELSERVRPTEGEVIPDLASGDSKFSIYGSCMVGGRPEGWTANPSWNEIISFVGPSLLSPLSELSAESLFSSAIYKNTNHLVASRITLKGSLYDTIKLQLIALGYVRIEGNYWHLTELGKKVMFLVRTVRAPQTSAQPES